MFWAYSLSFLFLWDSGGKAQGQAIAPMRSVPRLRIESGPAGLTGSTLMFAPWRWLCVHLFFMGPLLPSLQFHIWSGCPVRKALPRGDFVFTFTVGLLCSWSLTPFIHLFLPQVLPSLSNSRNSCALRWALPLLFSSFRDEVSCISAWHQTNHVTMDSPASEPFASTAWVLGAHICNAFSIFIQCLGSNPGFHVF